MGSGIYKQLMDIKQDVGKIANKIASGVAKKALEDMKTAHSNIMDSYYGGYTPRTYYSYESPKTGMRIVTNGYRRTNNLRNNSIVPQGIVKVGEHGFKATVEIGSANMDNYTNNMGITFPSSGVFDLVWNDGNRGLPPQYRGHVELFSISTSVEGISMSGTPENAMQQFMDQWGLVVGTKEADRIAHSI